MDEYIHNFSERSIFKSGVAVFKELKGSKRQIELWKINRNSAYNGSLQHFLSCIYKGTTSIEGFEVRLLKQVSTDTAKKYLNIKTDTVYRNNDKFKSLVDSIFEKGSPAYTSFFTSFNKWLNDTTKKTFKISVFNSKTNSFITYEFSKDEFSTEKILVENYPSELLKNSNNGKVDILIDQLINTDSLLQNFDSDSKVFKFEDFLHVTYLKEIEEHEYIIESNPFSKRAASTQYSIISLLNPDGILVFENGNFQNAFDLLVNKYWAFEKLDKLMPLEYRQ